MTKVRYNLTVDYRLNRDASNVYSVHKNQTFSSLSHWYNLYHSIIHKIQSIQSSMITIGIVLFQQQQQKNHFNEMISYESTG